MRLLVVPLLAVAVLISARANAATVPPSKAWDAHVERFLHGYFERNPDTAVSLGRHEYDGRVPDWSAAGIRGAIAWLHQQRDGTQRFDAASLDDRQKLERERLLAQIDGDLFWLETAEWPFRSPRFYGLDPNVYVTREYAPLPVRLQAFTKFAAAVPGATREIRANLRLPLPRSYVKIGRVSFGGLASYFEKDVPPVFAAVKDEKLQARFRKANAAAIAALKDLDAWFAGQEKTASDDFALGAAKFQQMLRDTEGVDLPLAHLTEIGERDLARNLAALDEACAAFAPGKTIAECIAAAEADKPEGNPVESARAQLDDLRAFVADKGVATIPSEDRAIVRESPPYQRWNFAFIDIPGPYEKNLPSIYYISPPDPAWTKAEQEAYLPSRANLLFTSVHEVWPGHFLQFLHAHQSRFPLGRVFGDYAFAEGWAHYCEEMMWEMGLGEGRPATHIGQVLQALLRDVRFLSAIGLHTRGMSEADSERMFREKAYQDPGTARQQAARGTFDPAYLNYTLGKLMIRKLRDDWTATRGGRAAWKSFHDTFLSYGSLPIPMVRRLMLGGDGKLLD
jgi:hypothetical protein